MVNCDLYEAKTNPEAIILRASGAKKSPNNIMRVPAKVRKQKRENRREAALDFPSFTRIFEKTGINEIFKMPSENIFRIRSKGLKAIKNASLWEETPKKRAIRASLIRPNTRLTRVRELTTAVFFKVFITSFP